MKSIYLILFLLVASCGKNNSVSSSNELKVFPAKYDLLLLNKDDNYHFRQEVLNAFVESKITGEEVDFDGFTTLEKELEDQQINSAQLENYKFKNSKFGKLVVSYKEKTEVYFIPENSNINNLIRDLSITADEANKLVWLNKKEFITNTDMNLYLISLDYSEMIENDKKYFRKVEPLMTKNEQIVLKKGTDTEVVIFYESLIEELSTKKVNGKIEMAGKYDAEYMRDAYCEMSVYYKNGNVIKTNSNIKSELGLKIEVNGVEAKLTEQIKDKNTLRVKFSNDEKNVALPSMKINYAEVAVRTEVFNAFNYSSLCNKKQSVQLDRRIVSKYKVDLIQYGRGEDLRAIKL